MVCTTCLLLESAESSKDSCVATVYDENDRDIRRIAKSKKIENSDWLENII
jgi:hypothetical protein